MKSASATFRHSWLFVLAAAPVGPADVLAQDNGIYIGAAAMRVSADYGWREDLLEAASNDDASGFRLIGGVRPLDHFAIEADYADLGTAHASLDIACPAIVGYPCPSEASIDAKALSVSALGFLTLPLLDIYGRIGFSRWEAEGDVRFTSDGAGLSVPTTREGTDPTLGAGIQFRFASVALRVEYQHYEILDDSANAVSVGFTYTFL